MVPHDNDCLRNKSMSELLIHENQKREECSGVSCILYCFDFVNSVRRGGHIACEIVFLCCVRSDLRTVEQVDVSKEEKECVNAMDFDGR